jgi:hypothetical protein
MENFAEKEIACLVQLFFAFEHHLLIEMETQFYGLV